MNVSFKGMFAQAIKQAEDAQRILDDISEIAEKLRDCYLDDDADHEKLTQVLDNLDDYDQEYQMFLRFPTLICHDTLLAIATEKCSPKQLRDFMFGGASIEEINKIPTKELVTF